MLVTTPERVALSMPVAGIGSRTGAYLIDALLLLLFWSALYFALSFVADIEALVSSMSSLVQMVAVFGLFATQWVFWTACEVFWNGQTPGKRIAGIRVVREDGSPVGFFESAVRNLLRAIDFLPAGYAVGLVSMLFSRQGRRLGDLAAGTILVRQEKIDLDRYAIAESGNTAGDARIGDSRDVELVLSFLERAPGMDAVARLKIAAGLVQRIGPDLPDDQRARLTHSWEDAERFLRNCVRR
ncbi:MAG: RDD family protein [Myxococcaceae bacterium]